jgi:hypothetical protein
MISSIKYVKADDMCVSFHTLHKCGRAAGAGICEKSRRSGSHEWTKSIRAT